MFEGFTSFCVMFKPSVVESLDFGFKLDERWIFNHLC